METLHTAIMVTGVPKKEHCTTETNYVDLGSTNTVKVSFTSEGNQRAVFKHKGNYVENEESCTDHRKAGKDVSYDILDKDLKIESFLEKEETAVMSHEPEETDYTDMYLNSRCESESESEDGDPDEREHDMPVAEEIESHYITTHEIQLTELDHDMDHELGRAASSCWDYEDDNLVYSFVDYASFKSGDQPSGERGQRRAASSRPPKLAATKALISTESECASSDDGVRNIHVSIKASSKSVSESVRPSLDENELLRSYHETHAKIEVPYESHTHCFIPAPGRQHLASKLMKGKDVTEYSSGASSSVSELDDADKEVRTLTAKSFRSLACPYFDTIDLRPSSESSVSEHSLSMNKWSSFIDFNYRNYVMQGGVTGERKNSTCSVEMRKCTESATVNVNNMTESRSHETNTQSSKYKASCDTERRVKCTQNRSNSCEPSTSQTCDQTDVSVDGVHKKAVFASSLLQNVISKKMRFEQERKLECGEVSSAHRDSTSCQVLQRQASESGSLQSVVSVEEVVESSNAAFNKGEEEEREEPCKTSRTPSTENMNEPLKASLLEENNICAEKSETIFPKGYTERDVTNTTASVEAAKENKKACAEVTNSKTTKMSHLYVPGSHFHSKEREAVEPYTPITQTADLIQSDSKTANTVDASNGSKAQEITIRLQSIKENKNNLQRPFNIASLLTPNLTKHSSDTKSEKIPHFTVRDVRDSRCKLQTPIHQVRDVRKLVKSSYRFVSMESGENKTTSQEESDGVKKDPDKNDKKEKTPMVIKCHSVNTNSNRQNDLESERSPMQTISEQQELQIKSSRFKESSDKRVECKMPNQVALEKLKAAVKTMEQLYVFDRNEWRRKTEAPRPVKDSHVLSLITREEQGVDSERLVRAEPPKNSTPAAGTNFTRTITHHLQQDAQCSNACNNISRSTKSPFSLKFCPSKCTMEKRVEDEAGVTVTSPVMDSVTKHPPAPVSDSENYLTIPIKPCPLDTKPHCSEQILDPAVQPQLQPCPPLQRSPVVTESWSPGSPTLTFCQPAQILCVTPPTDPLISNMQRKLLLDPITGQCYLVDTPISLQPVTQRLYCPESAQYLDVPLALSPAAYLISPPSFVQPHSTPVSSQDESASNRTSMEVGGAKPVISITSQQGPRIVAPPSFDGTTMSFVVEHR
ncbi:uncharacterized protein C4orf54-like [Tachysurus vachellii]|uniref:uncharacterized protein C4orf54-like n=1 Tax=Tachysurus vachellii TaxID=175792 RepID=UPI00296B4BEC|nr:uncharacterized protein C4orf54-like [Tachysurus vachellii]